MLSVYFIKKYFYKNIKKINTNKKMKLFLLFFIKALLNRKKKIYNYFFNGLIIFFITLFVESIEY